MFKPAMNVLLIDDHPLINKGLAACLEETGRFTISGGGGGGASNLAEAQHIIENIINLPSIIILDIMLGKENGLDFLPWLEKYCSSKKIPKPPVLVCSVLEDPFRLHAAQKMGAAGFVSKTGGIAEILRAIDTVLNGEIYFSEEHNKILEASQETHSQFTKREQEVLQHIKHGLTNQQIAQSLHISIRTVENHISNIYFKTGCTVRHQLMKL